MRFRRDGIGATGPQPLMKALNLTHDGFYAHFKSKDELGEKPGDDVDAGRCAGTGQECRKRAVGDADHGRSKRQFESAGFKG